MFNNDVFEDFLLNSNPGSPATNTASLANNNNEGNLPYIDNSVHSEHYFFTVPTTVDSNNVNLRRASSIESPNEKVTSVSPVNISINPSSAE